MRLQSSERCVSRRAMTSRTFCGMASRTTARRIRLGCPRATRRRTVSPTKSGLPSVCSCRAAPSSRRRDRRAPSARGIPSPRARSGRRARADACRGSRATSTSISVSGCPGDRIDVAEGTEHEQPDRAELAGEKPEQHERRRIRGVQIVQDEHGRLIARHALRRNSAVASEQAEPRPSESSGGGLGQPGERLAQLGQDLRQLDRARAELGAQQLRRRLRARTPRSDCTHGQ